MANVFSIRGATNPPSPAGPRSSPPLQPRASTPLQPLASTPLNTRVQNTAVPIIRATQLPDESSLVLYKRIVNWQGHRYLLEAELPRGQQQTWDEIVSDLQKEIFATFPTQSGIQPGTLEMEFTFDAAQGITVAAGNNREHFEQETHKTIAKKFLNCYSGGSVSRSIDSPTASATATTRDLQPPHGRVLSTLTPPNPRHDDELFHDAHEPRESRPSSPPLSRATLPSSVFRSIDSPAASATATTRDLQPPHSRVLSTSTPPNLRQDHDDDSTHVNRTHFSIQNPPQPLPPPQVPMAQRQPPREYANDAQEPEGSRPLSPSPSVATFHAPVSSVEELTELDNDSPPTDPANQ